MEVNVVQLVGGHADGTELSIIDLPMELHFRVYDGTRYAYGDWNHTDEVTHLEIYTNLPSTTIYILKRIK